MFELLECRAGSFRTAFAWPESRSFYAVLFVGLAVNLDSETHSTLPMVRCTCSAFVLGIAVNYLGLAIGPL